jgi:hypothetical protein
VILVSDFRIKIKIIAFPKLCKDCLSLSFFSSAVTSMVCFGTTYFTVASRERVEVKRGSKIEERIDAGSLALYHDNSKTVVRCQRILFPLLKSKDVLLRFVPF